MEKGSTTLVLRKMSINASMRCHLTLIRVDTTSDKKKKKIMNLGWCQEEWTFELFVVGRNANEYSHCGKYEQYTMLYIEHHMAQPSLCWVSIQTKLNKHVKEVAAWMCLLQHYSQKQRSEITVFIISMSWQWKFIIIIRKYYSSLRKDRLTFSVWGNMIVIQIIECYRGLVIGPALEAEAHFCHSLAWWLRGFSDLLQIYIP